MSSWVKGKGPADTCRGRIWNYVSRHIDELEGPILELGSRAPAPLAHVPWVDFRSMRPGVEWIGADIQAGWNVDQLIDFETDADALGIRRFGGALCCEVLEHTWRPWLVLQNLRYVLRKGGHLIVTVPFCFYVHNYPSDYWRFTPECLKRLLEQSHFEVLELEQEHMMSLHYADHASFDVVETQAPQSIFAFARAL